MEIEPQKIRTYQETPGANYQWKSVQGFFGQRHRQVAINWELCCRPAMRSDHPQAGEKGFWYASEQSPQSGGNWLLCRSNRTVLEDGIGSASLRLCSMSF